MTTTPDASTALAVREKVQNFLNAAITGNLQFLQKVAKQLDEGKGMAKTIEAIKDGNDRTALHFAAREGRTEICKYLLEELKLDVNVKDAEGETPLVHAARLGHIATVNYLLEHGADPSIASDLGATALHHAAGIGNLELMKLLFSKGVAVDSQSDSGTPLVWAAGHGQKDALKALLDHNANPNIETDDGITPLLSAVAAGSLACLKELIKAGANVNVSAGGATPLHIAADSGSSDIINCLVKAGADTNMTDEDGLKAIQVAAASGDRTVVEILFPLTTPVQSIPNWTVDGLIEHMQSETEKQADLVRGFKEGASINDKDLPKQNLPEVTAEAKLKSAEAKARGENAFKRNDFALAIDAYTQAIDLDPTNAALFSNRSLCWLRLGQAEQALSDAKTSRSLRPDWAKAAYREGAALRLLERFEEAANAFYEGVELEPENTALVSAFREAVEAGKKFHGADTKA